MTQDLRLKDQAAQDRIDILQDQVDTLESQLDAADIENEELKQKVKTLMVQLNQMITDRTFVLELSVDED